MSVSEPRLVVEQLRAGYGNIVALDGVSLEVGTGELVAILGTNGAGKSTLLRTISGSVAPRGGVVRLDGHDVTGLRSDLLVRRGLAHVPEGRRILPGLTVTENLRLGAYSRRDRAAIAADLDAVFGRFPVLGQRCSQRAGTLSGGEQQMLAIGRGLMSRPRILLLDEPSLGLAPLLVRAVFDLIEQLRADGQTVLLVEQNATQSLAISDRAYVLTRGRIAASGRASELRADPAIAQGILGGIPT
jgi:branched-chain amino acid transport system ATP-binding protein